MSKSISSSSSTSTNSVGATEKARAITNQLWPDLGSNYPLQICGAPTEKAEIIERVCYMLLIRLAALITMRNTNLKQVFRADDLDLSTIDEIVPVEVQRQLFEYVGNILGTYREVHYHSIEHAYHVIISSNKLLDMLLQPDLPSNSAKRTFGIRSNPLMQLALIYAAVIHDADHQGVSNAQLVIEGTDLAMLYNDQSVAEQHALSIGFRMLNEPQYELLKKTMFQDITEYRFFRKIVIELVLCTDVASPERMQIVKSKWKEAFGETSEKKEARKKQQIMKESNIRRSLLLTNANKIHNNGIGRGKEHSSSNDINHDDYYPSSPSDSETSPEDDEQHDMEHENEPYDQFPPVRTIGVRAISRLSAISTLSHDARAVLEDEEINRFLEEDDDLSLIHENRTLAAGDSTTGGCGGNFPMSLSRKSLQRRSICSTEVRHNDSFTLTLDKDDAPAYFDQQNMHNASDNATVDSSGSFFKMTRRGSAPIQGFEGNRSRQLRLGVRMAIDLTGNSIESFAVGASNLSLKAFQCTLSHNSAGNSGKGIAAFGRGRSITSSKGRGIDSCFNDAPDDFKAIVVLETMLKGADISANMQSWGRYKLWSSRLFFEQKYAFEGGRNTIDPVAGWFDLQIIFIDSYVIPLARRLNDTGVFGMQGTQFVSYVQEIRRKWLQEGKEFTKWLTKRWSKIRNAEKTKLRAPNDASS